jgi:predicted RNase H-like HicB family nuclease
MSDLQEFLGLPYTVLLRRDVEGDFVAKIEELPGCSAHGKTREEALQNLDEAKSMWIGDCLENGDPIPPPAEDEPLPSGKWLQRVPRGLHRKLQVLARKDGISFNQYVASLLAEAVGQRNAAPTRAIDPQFEERLGTVWAEYFGKAQFEPTPVHWHVTELTPIPANFAKFGFSQVLAHWSSQLPNEFRIKTRVKKDEKKKHTSLEAC